MLYFHWKSRQFFFSSFLLCQLKFITAFPILMVCFCFIFFPGIKCPVCSKFVLPDDIECHLVMCLTKPRLSYNGKSEMGKCFDSNWIELRVCIFPSSFYFENDYNCAMLISFKLFYRGRFNRCQGRMCNMFRRFKCRWCDCKVAMFMYLSQRVSKVTVVASVTAATQLIYMQFYVLVIRWPHSIMTLSRSLHWIMAPWAMHT